MVFGNVLIIVLNRFKPFCHVRIDDRKCRHKFNGLMTVDQDNAIFVDRDRLDILTFGQTPLTNLPSFFLDNRLKSLTVSRTQIYFTTTARTRFVIELYLILL